MSWIRHLRHSRLGQSLIYNRIRESKANRALYKVTLNINVTYLLVFILIAENHRISQHLMILCINI